jgi:hypothetical protein
MDTAITRIGGVVLDELRSADYMGSTIGQYEKTIRALTARDGCTTPARGWAVARDVEEPSAAGLGQLVQGNRQRVRGHRGPGRGRHRALAGRGGGGGRLSFGAHRND